MKINFTYDPGTSLDHMLVFETAANIWETYLQDNVTVNLHAGVTSSSNLPTGVIGGALPGMKAQSSYGEFRNRIAQDVKSQDDITVNNNLRWGDNAVKYEQFMWDGNNAGEYATSGTINMTRANAKALAFDLSNSQQGLDGYILLSDLAGTGVSWDTTTASADAGKLDLLSTAMHEIGHALGFISGVDQPGAMSAYFAAWDQNKWNQTVQTWRDRVKYTNPLDLFRFSVNSRDLPDATYGSQFSEKYFSIDGGKTSLFKFASGSETNLGGDGYQASHWKNQGNAGGIMDPTLALGERAKVSSLDLKALDVIGWNIITSGANTTLNLTTLQSQAQQELASRLGKTTSWLLANKTQAAQQLSQVRVGDIIAMAQESQVYDLSWMNPTGGVSHWLNWWNSTGGNQSFWLNWWNSGGGNGWWQMMAQAFEQRGLFATIDPSELNAGSASAEIDALTGVPVQQQPLAASPSDVETAPPNRQPAELFDSSVVSQDPLFGYGQSAGSGASGEPTYGEMALLQLGSGYGGDVLATGLGGLSQDQLQGAMAGLSQALSTGHGLG